MQFIGSIAKMTGAGIFLLVINIKLGVAIFASGSADFGFYSGCLAVGKKEERH